MLNEDRNMNQSMNGLRLDDIEMGIGKWNNKLERSIQSLGELSLGYKWMHCEMAKNYSLVYNRLMYMSIALGPIVGVVNTINQTYNDRTFVPILITILSFLTGVLAGIIKFTDYEEKISNHKSAAAKYTSLANNARIQLNLERYDREDPKQYIVWYTTSYGNLFESAPILPDNVMLKWRKHALKHGFKIPGEVGILMEQSESESVQKEVNELKNELNKIVPKLPTNLLKGSVDTPESNDTNDTNGTGGTNDTTDSFRLMMYNLGEQHSTDFKTTDLAKFSKIMMKRKMNKMVEIDTMRQMSTDPCETWRDNLPD